MKNFQELLESFHDRQRKRTVVVVCPDDEHTAEVVQRCQAENLASLILVTVKGKPMPEVAPGTPVKECADKDEAAAVGVELVRTGQGDVLMKGNINTDNLLRAVLHENGLLPKGRIMSHLTATVIPSYHKMLFFSDAAVIPRPDLAKFEAMIEYDVEAAHRMGIKSPRVALIHFTEKVNQKFPHTLDYQTILERAAEGKYSDAIIGGPMDVKTACDPHSGSVKGIDSPVGGDADILIFPNLEAANTFYKTVSLFAKAPMAGVITGTTAPVVVPSRADSAESKFYSLALACALADE